MTKKEQLQKISEEYLSAFLGFAIQKLGDFAEAEELAQEIAFQTVVAVHRGNVQKNFDAYLWSIAHNTFKRWRARKKPISLEGLPDAFSNIVSNEIPAIDEIISTEQANAVRLALSRLTSNYRKTIVHFYYDQLSIREISNHLSVSEGMVKFYLQAGRKKLKEVFDMNEIGEKSFHPSEFTIYKSGIDFSRVNVWEVFKRKLPYQIAILCHDNAKTIGDLSIETGTPAVYLEDEIELLLDAGVSICSVKEKYRTNFHILGQNSVMQLKEQFDRLFDSYVFSVMEAYQKYLPALKQCDVFKFDASQNQWAWYFAGNIVEFDYDGFSLSASDYPQILSCGSKAIVFAEATKGSIWAAGQTPTFLERCDVHPCDIVAFGEYHRQKELWDKRKAQALYDVYCENISDTDKEIYAELMEQGYIVWQEGRLCCNVAVTTQKSRSLFDMINGELSVALKKSCSEVRENISRIVRSTLPEQLKEYTKGYTETWISFYAGVYLREALYNKGFLRIPEKDDLTPVACWIYEK